mmetsp:Transcript_6164/g.21056  ORF Transcript_6164/g.21056 Transcript_6164/m.21056 type:complete len:267 (+) Transcript_6164:2914-3714(+)
MSIHHWLQQRCPHAPELATSVLDDLAHVIGAAVPHPVGAPKKRGYGKALGARHLRLLHPELLVQVDGAVTFEDHEGHLPRPAPARHVLRPAHEGAANPAAPRHPGHRHLFDVHLPVGDRVAAAFHGEVQLAREPAHGQRDKPEGVPALVHRQSSESHLLVWVLAERALHLLEGGGAGAAPQEPLVREPLLEDGEKVLDPLPTQGLNTGHGLRRGGGSDCLRHCRGGAGGQPSFFWILSYRIQSQEPGTGLPGELPGFFWTNTRRRQ